MYRVILVDDERLIIRGLSSVVPWAELGCEVAGVAYDGKSGLELIRSLKPDIVMTDIRMPNMDGLTMLAAIRSEYPQIQTAVLTAYRDFDYARQALTLGVCRYLLKPSNLDELKPPGSRSPCLHPGTLLGTAPVPWRRGGPCLCEPVASVETAEPGNGAELFRPARFHADRQGQGTAGRRFHADSGRCGSHRLFGCRTFLPQLQALCGMYSGRIP